MAGDAVGGLAACEVDGDGYNLLGFNWKVQWVRNREGAIGNAYTVFSGKGDFLKSLCLDLVNAYCIVDGKGDCDGRNGKIGATKDI